METEEFEKEIDIYTKEGVTCYCENDEIDSREEGFMQGYLADVKNYAGGA